MAKEISFEEAMAINGKGDTCSSLVFYHIEMSNLLKHSYFEGCDVYAHDHTVKNFPSTKQLNLHLAKIGIGVSNNMTYKGQIKTLETILQENGHLDRIISYLKAGNMSQLDLIY